MTWIWVPYKGGAVRRQMTFGSLQQKADYLDNNASLDAHQAPVRELATRLSFARGPNDRAGYARDVHGFCQRSIRYVWGPEYQEFADSATILGRGWDNCAGKSRLFVALCRAVDMDARILPVFVNPNEFVHVQAQVRYPGSETEPLAQDGGWLRAELICIGAELGQGSEACEVDGHGRPVLS